MRFQGSVPASIIRAIDAEIQRLREGVSIPTDRAASEIRREIKELILFKKKLREQNGLKRLFPAI